MTAKNVKKRLLIIDDEANMRHMLSTVLKKAGYHVDTAADGAEGLEMIQQSQYDFILCDIKMPKMDGMEFLKLSRDRLGAATVIMMSAYGNIDTAIEAMKSGAYDYISKPFKTDEVYLTLKKAEERESLKAENRLLKERIKRLRVDYNFGKMVAKSKAMQSVFPIGEQSRTVQDNRTDTWRQRNRQRVDRTRHPLRRHEGGRAPYSRKLRRYS